MLALRIEVLDTPWDAKLLRIAAQKYRGNEFNNGSSVFKASNGFMLISGGSPRACEASDILYVRGSDPTRDNDVCLVPSALWLNKLRVAVSEYNATREEATKVEILE